MEDEIYDYPEDFESAGEEDDLNKMRKHENSNMIQRLYNRNSKYNVTFFKLLIVAPFKVIIFFGSILRRFFGISAKNVYLF